MVVIKKTIVKFLEFLIGQMFDSGDVLFEFVRMIAPHFHLNLVIGNFI